MSPEGSSHLRKLFHEFARLLHDEYPSARGTPARDIGRMVRLYDGYGIDREDTLLMEKDIRRSMGECWVFLSNADKEDRR